MIRRMILMLAGMAVFVAVLAGVKVWQIKSAITAYAAFQPPPEAVTTTLARQERWQATVDAIGTVAAVRGVTVSADLPGIVDAIRFESGTTVKAGDVLVQLDTRQERAQLAAAESQRDLSQLNLGRMRSMVEQRVVARAEYDKADADFKQATASAAEIRATIDRKTIRAPFSGVLGIREVNLGQYLAAGAEIVSLQSLTPIYANFDVPQQQMARIRNGTEVRLAIDGKAIEKAGRVTAIDSVVDPVTRNVRIQATFANTDGRLRPGMFVQAKAVLNAGENVIALPASAINYAPYGDSVFVVGDLKGAKGNYRGVTQRFVKLGATRGDQVAVLSGLSPGDEVVTSGVFKLRSGAPVRVNNSVQPGNNPAPKPEEG